MEFVNNNANGISAIGSISSALVAVVAALIAALAVKYSKDLLNENRILRLSGLDPEIVAYLAIDEQVSNCLNFTLENVGSGPAFDVSFNVDIDDQTRKEKSIALNKSIGSIPFTVIPQGKSIVSTFGLGFDLLAEPKLKPFTVLTSYKNLRGVQISKSTMIDASQFLNIGKYKPADPLDKIQNDLSAIANKLEGLRMEISKISADNDQTE